MDLTNYQVFQLFETLYKLVTQKQATFPIKVGYTLLRNKSCLQSYYEDIVAVLNNMTQQEELTEFSNFVNTDIPLTKIKLSDIEELALPIDLLEGLMLLIDGES